MNGLALREHVGMLLVARLSRREPLQGCAVLGGLHCYADCDFRLRVAFMLIVDFNVQRGAVWFGP